ncbi:MAG: molybdopterin molybdotransferase MoeA [Halobacteriovoraceae bacterium]|nr:molybdopterin molybdotransferase MoeA [Halobacteriovoraceae bacterium]
MIGVVEALEILKANTFPFYSEVIGLEFICGRVLAQNIYATRMQPPFDRVAMDGVAINLKNYSQSSNIIEEVQKAGEKAKNLENLQNVIEVMTGATLPNGTDTVVPYEECHIENSRVEISNMDQVKLGQNIHCLGSDCQTGDLLIQKGVQITSAHVSLIAGQGISEVSVYRFPKVAIISTGDELIAPGISCEDYQIWRSNPYAVQAELIAIGGTRENISLFHLLDDESETEEKIKEILNSFDVLILSGGVSKGKFDYVPNALKNLGAQIQFHKIKQKPGKPMLFATVKERNKAIFGLPGNPVSALICFKRYVVPYFNLCMNINPKPKTAIFNSDIKLKKDFTLFCPVITEIDDKGQTIATSIDSNGSGDFISLGNSHGFLEILPQKESQVCEYFQWGQL